MKTSVKFINVLVILLLALNLHAQVHNQGDFLLIDTIASPDVGRVRLRSIENRYDTTVLITFENEYSGFKSAPQPLRKGEKKSWDYTFNVIWVKSVTPSPSIEYRRYSTPEVEIGKHITDTDNVIVEDTTEVVALSKKVVEDKGRKDKLNTRSEVNGKKESAPIRENRNKRRKEVDAAIPLKVIVNDFYEFIDSIPVLSEVRLAADSIFIDKHIENLQLHSINKVAYVKEQKLKRFVDEQTDTIQHLRAVDTVLITDFLLRYGAKEIEAKDSCIVLLSTIVTEKIDRRDSLIATLSAVIGEKLWVGVVTGIDGKTAGVYIAIVLLCILLLLWYRKTYKSQHKKRLEKKENRSLMDETDAPSVIVVGQKGLPTLKKQCLDDVFDNESYFRIESKEFCQESAIRTLYIKNTCVKDIYNMYAEDLRNPENPKEDGCMVLGRWVFDEVAQLYDVSLEYVVQPGDDAVFEKYELNFGGKIKLKVSEKLRRLRRETNLQYDLTCWVHSHPGLGVFFSNSDNNVHMQLKHPVHPKFLTAFVIDILTPQQEMGIFTFRQDETVNSKNDLVKMYSLEELYKWALASERKTLDVDDYFDTLGQNKNHLNECYGIQLCNGAIIDMTFLAAKQNGFIGFVHGFTVERGERMQCIIASVSKNETVPDNEMLGCFVVASHCSIPSIRKVVARYLSDVRFIFVYTVTDGMLTSIPVINQDLCTSELYYGEQKLEDLKIWTRRKR